MASETKWRRRWKPTLDTVAWSPLLGDQYLIKHLFSRNTYEIMITNKTVTYYELLSEEECLKRSKKLNPSVEAPLGTLLDHVKDNLSTDSKSSKIKVKVAEEKLIVNLETTLAGLPFNWRFHLRECDPEMVALHLTVPLMGMIGELLRRQKELMKIIINKDKEIDDYKNQGVKVTRKHLQTAAFDEKVFQDNMNTSKGFESQVKSMEGLILTDEAQELYQNMMMKKAFQQRDISEDEDISDDTAATQRSPVKQSVGNSWINKVPELVGQATGSSASLSPSKNPSKSPQKSTPDVSPVKDSELLRRQALERKLAEEEGKMEEKQKKKKKKLKI